MNQIKLLRKSKKISQQALADSLGVSRSTIAMWETSGSQPDNTSLLRLADYFNVSVDYLLGRDDEDIKKEAAALSDDDLNSEIINMLTSLFPGREEFALKTLQTISEIPEEKHELALGMLQVLRDHEA